MDDASPILERSRTSRLVLVAIGTGVGVILWAIATWGGEEGQLGTLSAVALFAASAAGLLGQFGWGGRPSPRWAGAALGVAALFGLVTFVVWRQVPLEDSAFRGDELRMLTWIPAAFVALYVLAPFAQIWIRSGRLRFPYPELFHHSWNNFFVGLVAHFFLSAFGALILLWGALFDVLGIDVFKNVFESDPFVFLVYPSVWGLGVAIGRESERITNALRRITLTMIHALMPVLVAIALLFLAVLPFTGLAPLFDTRHATPLVLALLSCLVLFQNAVYQDGLSESPYGATLRRAVEVALLCAPAYAAIAAYATWLRVDQYGFTPQRVFAAVFIGVVSCYALGYAVAVVARREPWMGLLRPVNVSVAWLVVALALALHTPLLDPLRISAASQFARMASGAVAPEDFDLGVLRFKLGHAGQARLEALAELDTHPFHEALREHLAAVSAASSYYEVAGEESWSPRVEDFALFPPELVVPAALAAVIEESQGLSGRCSAGAHCTILAVDLDRDGATEYCIVWDHWNDPPCFGGSEGEGWHGIGHLHALGTRAPQDELAEALRAGDFELVQPAQQDLRIGETLLRLAE